MLYPDKGTFHSVNLSIVASKVFSKEPVASDPDTVYYATHLSYSWLSHKEYYIFEKQPSSIFC